jgi:exodeoxyribonuclease VII large subunit
MGDVRGDLPLFSWAGESRPFLTVSEVSQKIKGMLERGLEPVWVLGEISNCRVPPSGHLYFTLKDDKSQLAAVMFRSQGKTLSFQPDDGMQVLCFGRVGLYSARGDLQLYVDSMEPRGVGSLHLAFEQLKRKLGEEGLFDPERKRPLPFLPLSIGVVTSLRGAVLRDMLRVWGDRFADRRVVIRPVRVQGEGAASEIAQGIVDLGNSRLVEVMIVARGGGSLEDLWPFNEEAVARAIFASPVPVVSAVGHEVDFTIADFVADRRAPTPTAAAAMVVPRKEELTDRLREVDHRLMKSLGNRLGKERDACQRLVRRLLDPGRRLRENQVRVDELSVNLGRRFQDSIARLNHRLAQSAGRLGVLSPLAVLERGYSIVHKMPEGDIVRSSAALIVGDTLRVTFARGRSLCKVEAKE